MSAADDILFAPVGVKSDIRVPLAWIEVVQSLRGRSGWGCTTLAGGALRDLDNGRPIKDVDIFVPHLGDNDAASENLIRAKIKGQSSIMEVAHDAFSASQVGKPGISHFHFQYCGWKFEISQKTDSFDYATLLDSFDLGICMISLDQSNAIYRAPEYNSDVSNKEITIVRKTGGREVEHAERLRKKYHGWTMRKV